MMMSFWMTQNGLTLCLLFFLQVFLATSLLDICKGGNALSIRITTCDRNVYMHSWMVACGSIKPTNPSMCPRVGTTTYTAKLPSNVAYLSACQRQSTTVSSSSEIAPTGLIHCPWLSRECQPLGHSRLEHRQAVLPHTLEISSRCVRVDGCGSKSQMAQTGCLALPMVTREAPSWVLF